MLAALADADREVRLPIINELGRIRARAAVPSMVSLLVHDDEDLAAAAARTLGAVGELNAATGEQLIVALDRAKPRLRRDAADALARVRRDDIPQLVRSLLSRLRATPPERRPDFAAALGGLVRGRGASEAVAREALLGLSEDDDASTACAAIAAVAALGDTDAAPRLTRLLLRDRPALVRRRIVSALGDLSRSDVAPLVERLADSDGSVRATAAWALSKSSDPTRATAALQRFVADHPQDRINAEAALARLRQPPKAVDFLVVHVVDHDGSPLVDTATRVTLSDGHSIDVWTDARGDLREESLPRGTCTVELSNR
jgi:hypothetical protein